MNDFTAIARELADALSAKGCGPFDGTVSMDLYMGCGPHSRPTYMVLIKAFGSIIYHASMADDFDAAVACARHAIENVEPPLTADDFAATVGIEVTP